MHPAIVHPKDLGCAASVSSPGGGQHPGACAVAGWCQPGLFCPWWRGAANGCATSASSTGCCCRPRNCAMVRGTVYSIFSYFDLMHLSSTFLKYTSRSLCLQEPILNYFMYLRSILLQYAIRVVSYVMPLSSSNTCTTHICVFYTRKTRGKSRMTPKPPGYRTGT